MDTIELDNLSQRQSPSQPRQPSSIPVTENSNLYVSSLILCLLGFLLALFPGFVQYLASSERGSGTALERFLCVQFGLYLLAIASSFVLNTEAHPLVVPLTAASSVASFIAYNTTPSHGLATIFFLANLVIALVGYATIFFANEPPHLSKTTGADKRTSAFIFGNKSAASEIKKAWRSEKRVK